MQHHPSPFEPAGIDPEALQAALRWAEADYHACTACAERCGVNRYEGPAGTCQLGEHAQVYKEYIHWGEEQSLVPGHTVYMTGCNFRCAFCSDWRQVTAPLEHGVQVSPRALALRIAQRRAEGARNLNFVGGTPDVNMLYILRTLEHVPTDTHVVWNSNLWSTDEAIFHLSKIVSTWLVDFKFGQDACALKLAQVRDFWRITTANYLSLRERVAGQPGRQILVRHLLMPGHLDCCTRPALDWLAEHLPDISVNLMTGYIPFRMANSRGPMGGRLPSPERDAALAYFAALPFREHLLDGVPFP